MNVPDNLRYSKDHEWVRVEGDTAVLGITDHAQSELGDVIFVELPDVGASFAAGDSMASLESVKAVSEVYSALTGEVVEINDGLIDAPETINDSPYADGWMVKLKLTDNSQLDSLLTAQAYQDYLKEEGGG